MGRNWLRTLQLDWQTIHLLKEKQPNRADSSPSSWYPELFCDELSTMKNVTASIHVKSEATPVFCKARTVPYLMKPKIDQELDCLIEANIIQPVVFAEWAAPIVLFLKPDNTVSICGDYKVTVNRFADVDRHPLPTPEDLFAMLSGGVLFTKLDMAHAYQQIELDERSKQYTT
ncbi:PREDICTED: uncharacterized protein K02A2.6-like [Priapulus caudatus]|uniref:Uncharacterized protein K02A2.6-like n=1 Tax=Priapulus caudatus TaxID=37621 RepID=A0ABM1EWP3_PRICU|nr:PREDICTED: uncharacterized protein K02A2.6-like [Priapulus caudatus]